MKRFLSSWQGLAAGALALAVYLCLPYLIRLYDPTAGAFDGGYLQWLGLACVAFYVAIWATWTGWQLAFPSTDKESDRHLAEWFKDLPPWGRWVAVQTTFLFLFWGFIQILKAIPL
jgi:hypothetical protein